ncbi:MAG TPA: methyltransferase domain-containing protein [Planctomycetota bacterium]|nr:methyltransferase domain-containing protein [Planctomycetota bacterium]
MTATDPGAPSRWLVSHRARLPPRGAALDVACGSGRNALWLAREGFATLGVDRHGDAVAAVNEIGRRLALPLTAVVRDLEGGDALSMGEAAYDVIVVVHYLHRPLVPALLTALRPGGVLVYETFTTAQAARGKPTNPAFLLEPGELRRLVAPLDVRAWREGDYEGRMIASVVAAKPAAGAASGTG